MKPLLQKVVMVVAEFLELNGLIAFLLLLIILFSVSAHAGQYWFKDRLPAKYVTVVYMEKVDCDGVDALGCYRGFGDFGVIIIKSGMSAWVTTCALHHEQHHADGYDHESALQPFIDCGDGNWASAQTFAGIK